MIDVSTGQLPDDFIDLEIFPTDRTLQLHFHLLSTDRNLRNLGTKWKIANRWVRVGRRAEQLAFHAAVGGYAAQKPGRESADIFRSPAVV